MAKKEDLKVGQMVWLYESGFGRKIEKPLTEQVISKIGNKFFELKEYGSELKFFTESLVNDGKGFTPRYRVYLDKQKYLDEKETQRLYSAIGKRFDIYATKDLPLEKLRKIAEILDVNTED